MVRILMIILSLFFCSITTCVAQNYITKKEVSGGAKKAFAKGMAAYSAGKNKEAIKEFSKALKSETNFIDAEIQRAAAHYDLKEFESAEKGFERVVELNPKYRTKVVYMLGKTEMILKKYEEAITHFNTYQNIEVKNKILLARAKKYALDCAFVKQAEENKVPFEPIKLSENINTDYAEYLPALTADERTMIFTRKVNGQEDFFICKRSDEGDWRIARPMTDINTPLNEGAQSISADGKFLVFTACNRPKGIGSCDLYFSEVKNKRWTKPTNMGAPINSRAWESQPSISADGKTLFFASTRGGSKGEQDIWYSTRKKDGTWNVPKNAGENINTASSDQSPFIHPDGQTLYFMSDGWPGMGKHDLFYSRLDEQGVWGVPTNLGFPINSPASEGALVISLDGKTAYFASDRENANIEVSSFDDGNSKADTDIYSFELYEEARPKPVTYVRARVFDAKTKNPLIAKVEFVNLDEGSIHSASDTDEDGDFLVCLPLGKNYALNVNKEKYIFHSENFALSDSNEGKPYFLDIFLQKIPTPAIASNDIPTGVKSEPIILKNVFFDTGSANLRSESFSELGKLKKLLVDNPNIAIEIYGHTDDVGTEQDNLVLSKNRAHSVYDYLIGHGIVKTRLSFKGFGESAPIDSNDTPDGRQLNRRTEFVIVE